MGSLSEIALVLGLRFGRRTRSASAPVEVRPRVLALPIGALVGFAIEFGARLMRFLHGWSFPSCSYRERRSRGSMSRSDVA